MHLLACLNRRKICNTKKVFEIDLEKGLHKMYFYKSFTVFVTITHCYEYRLDLLLIIGAPDRKTKGAQISNLVLELNVDLRYVIVGVIKLTSANLSWS